MLRSVVVVCLCLLLLPVITAQAAPLGSRSGSYASATAFLNGKEAYVLPASFKVGETFEVKVVIELKADAQFSLRLSASGFGSDKRQPYETVEGPSQFNERLDFTTTRRAGEKVELLWKLRPTDVWSGGTAPLNIAATFRDSRDLTVSDTIEFTIANIYIEPSGGAQPAPAAATPRQPGFGFPQAAVAIAALGVLAAFRPRVL